MISLNDVTLKNCSTGDHELITMTSLTNVDINSLEVRDIPEIILGIKKSEVTLIQNTTISGCEQAVTTKDSIIKSITGSNFSENGVDSLRKGGALYLVDSEVAVHNSSFVKNTAISGAAISFECTSLAKCNLGLSDIAFTENAAKQQGGAIYYNYKRPVMTNLTHTANSAPYGADIASYPVKIRIKGSDSNEMILNNVGSGIKYEEDIELALVDYDNQVMVLNNMNQISIVPVNNTEASMLGFNSVLLKNGIALFDNLIAKSAPGKENINFRTSSKAINSAKITTVFGESLSNNTMTVNFRFCKPGEIQIDETSCSE